MDSMIICLNAKVINLINLLTNHLTKYF